MKAIEDTAIKNFLHGKASTTARTYYVAWRNFESYIKPKPMREATISDAVGFVGSLAQSKLAQQSVRNKVDALRSLYQFLEDIDEIPKNPFRAAKRVLSSRAKVQVRPTKILTAEQVRAVFQMPDIKTKNGVRDLALLAIAFGGGLRISEIHRIEIGHLRFSGDVPYIHLPTTKAGHQDDQVLPLWAWEMVKPHLDQRLAEGAREFDSLWSYYYIDGTNRGRVDMKTIYVTLKRYFAKAGVNAAPHAARATAATMLKNSGIEDRDVARFLRHSSTAMVAVYDKRSKTLDNHPASFLAYTDNNLNK